MRTFFSRCTLVILLVLGALHIWFQPAIVSANWCAEEYDFRIFDWNASLSDTNWNLGMDQEVADFIVANAAAIDANVITLQEVTPLCIRYIEAALPEWSCYYEWFDNPDDLIAVCVYGTATNFSSKRLCDVSEVDFPFNPPPYWWGYVQVEYGGVLFTNVHTRNTWKEEHVTQLHQEVTTGIICGDFNYVDATVNPGVPCDPDDPFVPNNLVWHQTDVDLEWTIDGYDSENNYYQIKIDHVLTVENSLRVCGDAIDDGSSWVPPVASAHRALLAGATFPQTVWVDFEYSGLETGSFSNPFNTLQEGVLAALPGDKVMIKAGVSLETLDINKLLLLKSWGGSAFIGP